MHTELPVFLELHHWEKNWTLELQSELLFNHIAIYELI